MALYATGYYPVTEGWFSEFARLIRLGSMPYRDFHLLITPLYPLQLAAFQNVFGEGLFALRILGIFVTCAIALALLEVLRFFFKPWIAACSSVVGTIYYMSGVAFLGYDFTQFLILYVLIGAALLLHSLRVNLPCIQTRLLAGAGGFFLGLALLTKQSNGFVALVGLGAGAAVAYFIVFERRAAVLQTLCAIAGALLPLAATALWLIDAGAVGPFFADVLGQASLAKGGIPTIASSWLWHFIIDPPGLLGLLRESVLGALQVIGIMTLIALVIEVLLAIEQRLSWNCTTFLTMLRRLRESMRSPVSSGRAATLSVLTILLIAGIITTAWAYGCSDCRAMPAELGQLRQAEMSWIVPFYFISALVGLVLLLRTRTPKAARFFVLAALGMVLIFGNGTSGGTSQVSMFLGMAVIFAYLLERALPYVFPAFIPISMALSLCTVYVDGKFNSPYSWWQVSTPPVRRGDCAPASGMLRGLCISPQEYSKIERISADITSNSTPAQAVYVYPHMPIFYLITDRSPYDGAVVSWFDFMGDREAQKVRRDILANPPSVVVVAQIPDAVLSAHEKLFRGGRPLIQRQIVRAIGRLVKRGVLKPVDHIASLDNLPIDVYKRVRSR